MAEPNDPGVLDPKHLRRYLPSELVEAIDGQRDSGLGAYTLEAFVHLAASRYTVTTYLPRILTHELLHERRENPWLLWRTGSLLFADLSGSTALAERLATMGREGIERVTGALNHIFDIMIERIERYGGDLIAFGGDALLVFFGEADHARAAAGASLALQEALRDYTHVVLGVGSFPMHLHIGVESGPVAFASVGLEHARYCAVLGPTVNRVATAEGLAGPREVVIGPGMLGQIGALAQGAAAAPGFLRLDALGGTALAYQPPPELLPDVAAPELAIPPLIDDLNRTSPYLAASLLEKIQLDPQLPQIEAELRPVTALFAQVVGLEDLAEYLPPAHAAQAIQTYITSMQEAVELFGGVINKVDVADEGLKLVAMFGAPIAYEDHAERAAMAAIAMQERMPQVLASLQAAMGEGAVVLAQRIGLNLGTVFAGNVGSAARKEYTMMGDAVNVAARVMSNAAWGEVWCSQAVADEVDARVVCEPRGEVSLKGKSNPVPLLRIVSLRESVAEELLPADGPLIGREPELAWLREHIAAVKAGQGSAVRIVGEAGVGKSRLTAALVADAQAAGFRTISASCYSYASGIPYNAWAEWLKSLCGIVASDSNAQRIRKLGAELAKLGPEMEEWLPIMGDLARLDIPENRLTRGLDPKQRQQRRFELLEQLLVHAAHDGPILALFEDLHWADPISLDLWQQVGPKLAGHTVLLVGVHRPELDLPEDAPLLRLRELSAEHSSQLIALLGGASSLPAETIDQIIERAAGNPLFLNELIHAVFAKVHDLERAGYAADQLDAADLQPALDNLPDSLHGLLLARIDQLEETSRTILRVASVIGQRIPFGVLRALQPVEQGTLVRQLVRLDEHEFTQLERIEPERVHIFRHALIQEVAYQSMLYSRRRDLHGRIGAYLERRYAGDLDDYLGLIAHHYRLSDRREKAIDYLLMAGDAASAIYASDEAIQYYEWALEALDDAADPRTWRARDALGDVLATIGRYDDALAQHSQVLAAPDITAEVARRAYGKRGSVLEKQGQYNQALDDLGRAMAIARSGAEGLSVLAIPIVCADIALIHQRRGEHDQAIAACEEGLRHITRDPRTHEDEQIEARLQSTLGAVYGMRGDYPRSRQHFEHSLRIREMIDDLPGLATAHNNLGYLWQLQSEYEKALDHYRITEEIVARINLRYMGVFASLNSAYALISLGRYHEARLRCQQALDLSREMNDRRNIAQAYDTLGLISYHQGDYATAVRAYEDAVEIHRLLGSGYQEGSSLANYAFALCAMGRHHEAAAAAARALALANESQSDRLRAEALSGLAEAHSALGQRDHAQAHARQALEIARRIHSKHDQGIAGRLLALALPADDPLHQALLDESAQIFTETKDQFELARTHMARGVVLIRSGQIEAALLLLKDAEHTFILLEANGERLRLQAIIEGAR
ncbi:tetratricopeptide repeat protein [Chloroflexia bacterium SDU3-3]|nr:tetratricopeptide repeat protein [Chloroflexia bacterium SDU3-3]